MTYSRFELTNLLPSINDWIETEIKYNSISWCYMFLVILKLISTFVLWSQKLYY
jgi:hypothetical protein